MKTKFHKSLTLVVSILLCWMVPAESWSAVEWDGIYYDLNTSAKTATVTSNPDKYSGHVFLPESISYHDGVTYTVTRIGTCAFLDCSSLTGITIPSSVTVIESSAFERCSGLTALTVGKGVTTIDYEAFKNCIRLATLILPASLKTIGNESFGGCSSLRTIVEERTTAPKIASTTFSSVDKAACTLYVPEGCRSAYANAAYWKLFTNIVDNRTDVLATGQCGDNVTYTIYSDMKMVISGEGEMWYNDGYENPICGDYSQSIQQLIIEEGVTTISHYAFFGYNRLTSVDIPPSITVLGNSAFRGCSSLERINIHNLTAWCGIEFGNTNMDYYPDAPFDNMPLYLNGELLEELVIEDEVTDISAGAFYNCRGLTSVYILADLPGIRPYTFDGCENVTFLFLGYSVGYFGWFSINMPNLRTFVLDVLEPPTLLYHMSILIGNATIYVPSSSLAAYQNDSGIYGDESWKEYSISLKGFMFDPGFGIFYGLEPENLTARVIDTEYMNSTVPFDITIPETITYDGATYTVTGIGHRAFELFNQMSEIILPSTITSVEDLAFNKLRGMTDVYSRAVEPPAASASSFQNMNVGSVVLHVPAASKEAYRSAEGWKDFASIVDEIVVLETGSCGDNLTYTIYSDMTMVITGTGEMWDFFFHYDSEDSPFLKYSNLIQQVIVEEGVTSIGMYSFDDCTSLTSVMMPNSVTSIGESSFGSCNNLSTITIPDNVTYVGVNAFEGTAWFNQQPNGLVYVGKAAYKYKGTMPEGSEVVIADGTTCISDAAFTDCIGLNSVTIPSSITYIGNSAFTGCSSLERINITDLAAWCGIVFGNTHMDYYPGAPFDNMPLYMNGELIEELVIPEGVTEINGGAFCNCSSLTSVYIPNSVHGIRRYAFDGCDNVTFLYIGNGFGFFGWCSLSMPNLRTFILDTDVPPAIEHMAIVVGSATIYVPYGTMSTYQNDSNTFTPGEESWKHFSRKFKEFMLSPEGIFYGLEPSELTTKVISIYYFDVTEPMEVIIPSTIVCDGVSYTVTCIGHKAFELCNEVMTDITLPSTITSVDDFAFSKCSALTDLYCRAVEPPAASAFAFGNLNVSEVVLRVPAGSKEAYESAEGWKDFVNIVEDEPSNAIYVDRVEGRIGGTMDIPVKLRNSYAVRGFQFEMELPEGTTINSWALSADRLPSGATLSDVLATQKIEGNKIIVACSLNYGEATFTGNDGEIATINVTFGEEMEAGTYPIYLTECDVTNAVGTDEALSDVTGTLILEDYVIGDANGDGKVRVGDAIAILSYIIGNTPENFNEKAADVNGDGLLRIGDVTAVLNIIVNQ